MAAACGVACHRLRQVSDIIEDSFTEGDEKSAEKKFKFLFNEFNGLMQKTGSRTISIAVRGFGYLAPACRLLMPREGELEQLCSTVVQRCEQVVCRVPN